MNKEPLLFCTPGGNETVLLSSRLFPTRLPVCVALHLALVLFFYFKQIRQTLVTQKHENGGGPQKRELTSLTQCEQANTMPTGHSFFLCEYTHLLLNDTTVAQ